MKESSLAITASEDLYIFRGSRLDEQITIWT